MQFNLKCFFSGHSMHRKVSQDYKKDGELWTRVTRVELVACERCGELNPNHSSHDILNSAPLAAQRAIEKARLTK